MKSVLLILAGLGLVLFFAQPVSAQGQATAFPEIYNSEPDPGEPLTPSAALRCLQLPPGFSATLFAAEPAVQNPIAATVDPRGRVWVAENYTYAERTQRFDLNLRDRVVVLEDRDGDGEAEHRTVFTDTVQMLTGIVVGQGGVWLMCPPQLLFVPDADGDLVPDGPAEVKLDGFHVARENYHNFANGLSWGPDSWLYGRCGASCAGEMGLPGTPDAARVPIRGGMWRYHPQRQVVEALTQGTTNPWGHDWNEVGDLFFINTVNGHLWHAIPGAHFVRPHTLDANPHTYELIEMHADHWHFDTGQSWTASRDGAANDYGGGHAHVGGLIYQENAWPEKYRGRLLTVNMHGRRVNTERLETEGSGYVARHEPDFLLSDDVWFRGMELLPLSDGNVLLLDWSDTGECHDSTGVHRTSGRIFKISFDKQLANIEGRQSSALESPAGRASATALADLQSRGSEWQARRARELLRSLTLSAQPAASNPQQAVSPSGRELDAAAIHLQKLLESDAATPLRLRGLFGLWAMERVTQKQLTHLLEDPDAMIRSWAVRLLSDNWEIDTTVGNRPVGDRLPTIDDSLVERLVRLARGETSAAVRLTLASMLQRLPLRQRSPLAEALMSHAGDAQDHNLPLMVWYGLMPLGDKADGPTDVAQLTALTELAGSSHWPQTRRLMARRVVNRIDDRPEATAQLIAVAIKSGDLALAEDVVQGMSQALAGRRQVNMPAGWQELQRRLSQDSSDEEIQRSLADLSVLFGDGVAIEELKRLAQDGSATIDQRRAALQSLVDARAPGLREMCLAMLKQRYLNVVAASGLAVEDDPAVGAELIKAYRSFAPQDRPRVVSLLASRPQWALLLLRAVAAGQIDRQEISAFQARQIVSHDQPQLQQLLADNWGQIRETSEEREQQIRELKQNLTPQAVSRAHAGRGRALFNKQCAACHTLFGEGGKLGPELTGAQRGNLDYLLENIVDPSAVVTKEFRATVVQLADGRVLTGLATGQTAAVLTLATQEETFQIATEDIVEQQQSTASTMPDGLLTQLTAEQIRDLFAYLQSTQQVVAVSP